MNNIKAIFTTFLLSITICLSQQTLAAQSDSDSSKQIFNTINSYRVKHGLSPFKYNETIAKVAQVHSQEMADKSVPFGHTGFNSRMHKLFGQFQHPRGIAENVAYTYLDVSKVVNLWLESSGHRKNIEGHFNLSGIGIARDHNGRVYATQIFLRA